MVSRPQLAVEQKSAVSVEECSLIMNSRNLKKHQKKSALIVQIVKIVTQLDIEIYSCRTNISLLWWNRILNPWMVEYIVNLRRLNVINEKKTISQNSISIRHHFEDSKHLLKFEPNAS
jgi:hypothetical protein